MNNGLFGIDTNGEMVELISNKDLNDSSKGRTSRILIGQASSSDFPYVAIEKERFFLSFKLKFELAWTNNFWPWMMAEKTNLIDRTGDLC